MTQSSAPQNHPAPTPTPVAAIGIGLPLSIQIDSIYPGKLLAHPSLMVFSGFKGPATFEAATKMINLYHRHAEERQILEPQAFDTGSPVLYYTSSLANEAELEFSLELKTHLFDSSILQNLSQVFNEASGLPVFLPDKSWLLVGSKLLHIADLLADFFNQGKTILSSNLTLRFQDPDFLQTAANMYAIYEASELEAYEPKVVDQGNGQIAAMVDKQTGKNTYQGDAPYLIVTVDGHNRDATLASFRTQAATSTVLEGLYAGDRAGTVASTVTTNLTTAMTLYNDHRSRHQAELQLAAMRTAVAAARALIPSSATYRSDYTTQQKAFQAADTLFTAYNNQIQTADMKITLPDTPAYTMPAEAT